MRIVFMGTPDFAVPCLRALYHAGYEIPLVVCQPDRPRGRHQDSVEPVPVKAEALALGLPVVQPAKATDPEFIERLRSLAPDYIVTAAYGKILRKVVLDIPARGCINVHASLLPRWRGSAPIQWAVIAGDPEAGVTSMLMDEGMDTGDILLQSRIAVDRHETGGSLFEKLSLLGADVLLKTLAGLEDGTVRPVKQPSEGITMAPMLKKEDGCLDFGKTAVETDRLVRGLFPWPGTCTRINGKLLKILKTSLPDQEPFKEDSKDTQPGTFRTEGDELYVRCADGWLRIEELQLEGKKAMNTVDFLRGSRGLFTAEEN